MGSREGGQGVGSVDRLPRVGAPKRTPQVAGAIAAADAAALATSLRETGSAPVVVDGEELSVTAEEVILSERPREGWSVANEHGETVAAALSAAEDADADRDVQRVLEQAVCQLLSA